MPTKDKPTVAVTRRFSEAIEARLEKLFDVRRNTDDRPLDRQAILDLCGNSDGLLCCSTEKIDGELIAKLPETVRIIASYSVGFDHVDIQAAKARQVCITNTPDVLTEATAETAMLLILAACRRAREWQHLIEDGNWSRWFPTQMLGMQLSASSVGFVGMGRIARTTASMLRPFGPKIRYWNRRQYDPDIVGDDIEFVPDLEKLLQLSNVVTVHVPGGAETRKLINADRLARMPKGSVLVNTARGSIIDDDALIDALKGGHLGGAGLDVFDGEPDFDQRYLDLPNVFMLPHIGSATHTARDGMGMRAIDNLEAFLTGGEPRDRVV